MHPGPVQPVPPVGAVGQTKLGHGGHTDFDEFVLGPFALLLRKDTGAGFVFCFDFFFFASNPVPKKERRIRRLIDIFVVFT